MLDPILGSLVSPYVGSFIYTSLGGIIITIWCLARFSRTLKVSPSTSAHHITHSPHRRVTSHVHKPFAILTLTASPSSSPLQ